MNIRTASARGVLDSLITNEVVSSRKSVAAMASPQVWSANEALLTNLKEAVHTSPINGYAALVNYAPSADKPVHRWFWYREGYSQALVREFIKDLPQGSLVLDPFCGAGTTLIAAREMGYPSVGLDVNPISTLVSRVKTTPLSPRDLLQLEGCLSEISGAHPGMPQDPKPALKIIDQVFDAQILSSLLVFRRLINGVLQPHLRDFLFVAWLSILEGVSSVQGGQRTQVQEQETDRFGLH